MDKQRAYISIIVPIYNSEKYLEQCIISIINQDLNQIEIILVDDGSTDSSGRICDFYAGRDTRIKVLHKKNEGSAKARKTGVQIATGTYVGFVDSDDWIEKEMFSELYRMAVLHNADIVAEGAIEDRNGSKQYLKNILPDGIYREDKERIYLLTNMMNCEDYFNLGIQPYLWNKLIRRELALKHMLTVDEEIRIGEDGAALYPMMADSGCIAVTSGYHYHYCIRKGSAIWKKEKGNKEYVSTRQLYKYLKWKLNECNVTPLLEKPLKRYIINNLLVRTYERYANYGADNVLYPFKGVKKGDSIILYGAGAFGRAVYEYASANNLLKVTLWVDRDAHSYQNLGLPVKQIDMVRPDEGVKVIIAVFSETAVKNIKDFLHGKGFLEEQLVWITITEKDEDAILLKLMN